MQRNNANGVRHDIIEQRATEKEYLVYEILDIVNEVRDIRYLVFTFYNKGRISVS